MQVRSKENGGSVMDIVDPSLNGEFMEKSMMKVLSVAIRSVDSVTANRPDMAEVVRVLTEAVELELSSRAKHTDYLSIPEDTSGEEDDSAVVTVDPPSFVVPR